MPWRRITRIWCAGSALLMSPLAPITPRPNRSLAFIDGPEHFASFEEILARTVEFNPGRSELSLRRGILHNAHELPDGRWTWNYDRVRDWQVDTSGGPSFEDLWDKVDRIVVPVTLWQGGRWSVIGDDDVAEWMRRRPDTRHIVVDGAGHSIPGRQAD